MSYSRLRDQKIADEYLGSTIGCRTCRAPTDIKTLNNLGGMCHPCYEHYLDPNPAMRPPLTLEQKRGMLAIARDILAPGANPGRVCANKLRARLARDGVLGPAQRKQLEALEAMLK